MAPSTGSVAGVNPSNGDIFQISPLNADTEGPSLNLERYAGYARAMHRSDVVGPKAEMRLTAGLDGPDDYAPYGSGGTGRSVRDMNADQSNARFDTVRVVSPGDAILGFPAGRIPIRNQVRMASVGGDIFGGKGLWMGESIGLTSISVPLEAPLRPDQISALARITDDNKRWDQWMQFSADNFAYVMAALAPITGAFNVEDASLSFLRYLWPLLDGVYDIDSMYWSDDMDGTGIVMGQFALSWAKLKRPEWYKKEPTKVFEDLKLVVLGAGAGAYGALNTYIALGAKPENILFMDTGPGGIGRKTGTMYPLYPGRQGVKGHFFKERMAIGNDAIRTPEDAAKFLQGADGIINLASPKLFQNDRQATTKMLKALAPDPFVLALTNPNAGLTLEELLADRPDALFGTGDQTKPNGANNFTAFSFILQGGLWAHARRVTSQMIAAAAWGAHEVAVLGPPPSIIDNLRLQRGELFTDEFGPLWLTALPNDLRLIGLEAGAAAMAALDSGQVPEHPNPQFITAAERAAYKARIDEQVRYKKKYVTLRRKEDAAHRPAHMAIKYPKAHAPLAWQGRIVWDVPPNGDKLPLASFHKLAKQIGIRAELRDEYLLPQDGDKPRKLDPKALTLAIERLVPNTQGDSEANKVAKAELTVIIQIAHIYPAFGLALAVRRYQAGHGQSDYTHALPTIFHKGGVMDVIHTEMPIAAEEASRISRLGERANGKASKTTPAAPNAGPVISAAPAPVRSVPDRRAKAAPESTDKGPQGTKASAGSDFYAGGSAAPKLEIQNHGLEVTSGSRLEIVNHPASRAPLLVQAHSPLAQQASTMGTQRFASRAPALQRAMVRRSLMVP